MAKRKHVPTHVEALKRAVAICDNSQTELAARMRKAGATKASQQLISYWLCESVLVGPKWWAAIESATAGAVTRRDLRPEVFSTEHAA